MDFPKPLWNGLEDLQKEKRDGQWPNFVKLFLEELSGAWGRLSRQVEPKDNLREGEATEPETGAH